MPAKQQLFFATRDDLLAGFQRLEEHVGVRYVRYGLFESSAPQIFPTARDIPQVGVLKGKSVSRQLNSDTKGL